MQVVEGDGFIAIFDAGDAGLSQLLFGRLEIFTFQPKDEAGNNTGPETSFNMTAMREFLVKNPTIGEPLIARCIFSQENYDHIINNNGVEPVKINRLSKRPDIFCQPPILLMWEDGSHVLADGNHRFVITWNMGIRSRDCYRVPEHIWRKFIVSL